VALGFMDVSHLSIYEVPACATPKMSLFFRMYPCARTQLRSGGNRPQKVTANNPTQCLRNGADRSESVGMSAVHLSLLGMAIGNAADNRQKAMEGLWEGSPPRLRVICNISRGDTLIKLVVYVTHFCCP